MTNILQEEASVFKYQSRGLFQAHNADRTRSILFRLPGLGAELWYHPFPRKTNGSPSLSVGATVVGIVGKSSTPPFDYEFSTVKTLKIQHGEKESSIDLSKLTELSDFEMTSATNWPEGPTRQAMFEKYRARRNAW